MNRLSWIVLSIACCGHLPAQTTIKQYYDIFPHRLKPSEVVGSMQDADTIVDNRNAYLHIRSKPNDCCSEYVTFTFSRPKRGGKYSPVKKACPQPRPTITEPLSMRSPTTNGRM